MGRVIRVGLIHRNRLFRECLASVLSDGQQFHVAEWDHADWSHLGSIEWERPDVVLLDLHLPEPLAVELIDHLRQQVEDTKILMLAKADAHEDVARCFAAGAHGCILEDSPLRELRTAVEKVVHGELFCSPEIVHVLFLRLAQTARESHSMQHARGGNLTRRELEVMELLADRLSNKQIARRLSVSLYTVKNHLHNILEKLHVEDRYQAVEYARKHHWLPSSKVNGHVGHR